MKLIFAVFYLIACSAQSVSAQVITSQELSKLAGEINTLQIAADGKELIDPANKSSVISFPKESFNVFFSSGFAYQAVYKNSGNDQLFLTENIDFSLAGKVTAMPVNSKSELQSIQVSFPRALVTDIIENGVKVNTVYNNAVTFYYVTGNNESKNKLTGHLQTLIELLAKERAKYHTQGNGKLTLTDGFYEGGYTNGNRRNGNGTMEYTNEPIYKGTWLYKGAWKNDRRQGAGIIKSIPYKKGDVVPVTNYKTTEIYTGNWVDDVLQGTGTYEKEGDFKYEGNFANGKMEGKGTSIDQNGSKYVGEWKNGVKEGKGILTTGSGGIYDGEWKNGFLEGQATYMSASIQYSGFFLKGKEHGKGTLKEGGNMYVGDWKSGMQRGNGEYTWANGDKYIGEWGGNYRDGKGIMYFATGDKYDGEWRSNKKSLQGTYTWKNGDKYTGGWTNDTMHRQGTMTYASGVRYEGEWRMGKPDGIGTWYDKDNNKIKDAGLDKPLLNDKYLRSKTKSLSRDKTYFVNYILTDSTLILYIPKSFPHTIYFDLQNDKKITNDIDLKFMYFRNGINSYGYVKSTQFHDRLDLLPARRDSNNIFELTFRLKDIVNLRRSIGIGNPKEIAFQITFWDEDKEVYLPKRKEEFDFTEGNMYYIPVSK